MLIVSVLVFPVAALAAIIVLVFGGYTLLTARDIRNVAVFAGFVAAIPLVVSVAVWRLRARESSKRMRRLGWVLSAVAAALIAGATLVFTHGSSPRNLTRPSVSGRAALYSVLTGHVGRWTAPGGPLTFDYRWQDCDPACADIPDATRKKYVPKTGDLRKRLRFAVAASPSRGVVVFTSEWSYSKETATVVP
jgi:hypothetical protein